MKKLNHFPSHLSVKTSLRIISRISPVLKFLILLKNKFIFLILILFVFFAGLSSSFAENQTTSSTTPTSSTSTTSNSSTAPSTPTTEPFATFNKNSNSTNSNAEFEFKNGLEQYQQKKFAEASASFSKALQLKPEDSHLWYNFSLSSLQEGRRGLALAASRKAQILDPSLRSVSSLQQQILSKLPVKEIPHEIEFYEELRSVLLNHLKLSQLLGLLAMTTLFAGWVTLMAFGRQKKSYFNWITGLLIGLQIFSLFLLITKYMDVRSERGTIIVEKASVMATAVADNSKETTSSTTTIAVTDNPSTASTKNATTRLGVFDVYEGFEVLILKKEGAWVQIQYPGGGLGWIERSQIFIYSEGV